MGGQFACIFLSKTLICQKLELSICLFFVNRISVSLPIVFLSFSPMHKFACHVYTTAEVYFVKGIFAIELTFFEGDIFLIGIFWGGFLD